MGVLKEVKKEKVAAQAAQAAAEEQLEDTVNCTICMAAPRTVLFLPCKHFICCAACAAELRSQDCPHCRQRIAQKVDGVIAPS